MWAKHVAMPWLALHTREVCDLLAACAGCLGSQTWGKVGRWQEQPSFRCLSHLVAGGKHVGDASIGVELRSGFGGINDLQVPAHKVAALTSHPVGACKARSHLDPARQIQRLCAGGSGAWSTVCTRQGCSQSALTAIRVTAHARSPRSPRQASLLEGGDQASALRGCGVQCGG